MVVVDANVLLYAVDSASADHERSRSWLDDSLAGVQAVGLAWVALLAFVRIATSPSIMATPLSVDEATDQVEAWLGAPAAVVAQPTPRHADLLRGLLRETGSAGNLTTDAHLAALAVEHGAEIVSYDRDFARFAGIRHRLPG
ncbi:MAG: type II toxin-antitoxin system VapC family toxin [Actinomycetota bacterium]|nr:type II toxin-antitoxin system VapC family toxin [Actinomycetota bacterium]MDQ3720931.1 type II toxin-antitoxin system VapC family toxin [Actinomycetota bacterium]